MTKVDKHLTSKMQLRRHFLEKYHAEGEPYVFDCFKGDGALWRSLREQVVIRYWGTDKRPDSTAHVKIDALQVLRTPGWRYDVVDINGPGRPWRHWLGLLPNVTKPTTVFLTVNESAAVDALGQDALGLGGLEYLAPELVLQLESLATHYILAMLNRYRLECIEAREVRPAPRKIRMFGVHLAPI